MTSSNTDRVGHVVRKTARATVSKVDASTDGPGGFTALVAVFGNLDSDGEVVVAGAFKDSLAARGDAPWPSLWSHQFYDDTAFIASFTAEETEEGLLIEATFLDTPRAQNIRALMAAGLVTEFSWSGAVTAGAWIEEQDGDNWSGHYEIRAVDLWEAGPCFKGANADTELLGVKSRAEVALKEGRVLAQKHVDALKTAITSLTELLAAVEKVDGDEAKTRTKDVGDPPDPGDPVATDPPDDPSGTPKPSAPAEGFVIPTNLTARLALA